jgi:hypothetical protein
VGQPVIIVAYQGTSPDNLSHFEFQTQTRQEAVTGWQRVEILWKQFVQPPWEGDGTAHFDPSNTMGLAFVFNAPDSGRNTGKLWVDDISLLSTVSSSSTDEVK